MQSKLFRNTTTVYYTTGDGEVHEQAGEAQLPNSSKPPQLPTEEERLLHELTHQPYRSWCEVCQRSKADQPTTNDKLQTDSEAAILQLGEHVACELGLRFRASSPHSHQSNGAVE